MLTRSGRDSQLKPSWKPAIRVSTAGSRPSSASRSNWLRSRPALKDTPSPRTTTTRTERGAGLREDAVDEAVGATCLLRQGTDAGAVLVLLLQLVRQRRPVASGDPLALRELNHVVPPPGPRCGACSCS